MANQIQNRRDTAANWTAENPLLAEGEIGYETDTGKFKIGDGSSLWNSITDYHAAGVDLTIIDGSTKPVSGNAVFDALALKATTTALTSGLAGKVSTTDSTVLAVNQTKFLSAYASLAAAITAIGSTATELKVTSSITVPASATIPATTKLVFEGNGKLTVASGQTLTIGSMMDPGNRQVFAMADATSRIKFSIGAVEKMNVAWIHGTATLCTNGINNYLASASTNGGGKIYIPEGTWTTAGSHALPSNTTIEGAGLASAGSGTTLRPTGAGQTLFTFNELKINLLFKNLTLDGNALATTNGIVGTGTGGTNTSAGNIRCEAVAFLNFYDGFRINASSSWQVAAISFDEFCVFAGNTNTAIRGSAVNSSWVIGANIYVPANATGMLIELAGTVTFKGTEFAGTAYAGDNQVVTQTIVAASGITSSGDMRSVVTASGMTNSPKTVTWSVTTASHTTAALIATAQRAAFAKDPDVASFFRPTGSGATVNLIRLDPAANDATMNFTVENVSAVGATVSGTATQTTAGAAETTMAHCAVWITGTHGAINFENTQDEGFRNSLINDGSSVDTQVNYIGGLVQSAIRLNQTTKLLLLGTNTVDRIVRDGAASGSSVVEICPTHQSGWYSRAGVLYPIDTANRALSNITNATGGSVLAFSVDTIKDRITAALPMRLFRNSLFAFDLQPRVSALSVSNEDVLFVGTGTETGEPVYGFGFARETSGGNAGRLRITGNQGTYGMDFNGDMRPTKLSTPPIVLAPSATIALNATLGNVFTLTPTSNCTINASGMSSGQDVTIVILTSGASSYNVTFGTGFTSQGVLATGVTTGKYFTVPFAAPTSAILVEKGTRGPAM